MTAKALILAGYGLNCEEETLHAFERSGLSGTIRHINDLIDNPKELQNIQILAVPGGFSYGDDTGSGNAFAQKMRLALWDHLQNFVARDTLTIGICNGCQILANLGLVPALGGQYGERTVAVTYNESARYQCRWIDLKINSASPWLSGVQTMHIPVAHGEGRFMMEEATLKRLQENKQIALQYIKKKECHPCESRDRGDTKQPDPVLQRDDIIWEHANGEFPYNPNGALADIAGITDPSGRVLAIMPHPERGMYTWQRDDYMSLKDKARREGSTLPEESDGMALFTNAARYFEIAKKKSA
ncbi:MAG: phosphoribosylformylglycinamidine synthase subunit PurQ [Alphaproteobacteria bacterium]|nr:phosphoribosylformylglycinamidine synthase subunit PurQ [Alphaproteobacteria bacterium]